MEARDIIKRPVITEFSADIMADKKYQRCCTRNL